MTTTPEEIFILPTAPGWIVGDLLSAVMHHVNNALAVVQGRASQLNHMVKESRENQGATPPPPQMMDKALTAIESNAVKMQVAFQALRGILAPVTAEDKSSPRDLSGVLGQLLTLWEERAKHRQVQLECQVQNLMARCPSADFALATHALLCHLFSALAAVEGERHLQLSSEETKNGHYFLVFKTNAPETAPIEDKYVNALELSFSWYQSMGLELLPRQENDRISFALMCS